MIDPDRLELVIRDNIEQLCRELFPHGVRKGNEWKIADTSGAKGTSLGICLSREKAGVFYDHATGDKGGFTDLLMANRSCPFPNAVEVIEKCLGINLRIEEVGKNGNAPFDWKSLEQLNPNYQSRLSKWRSYSLDFVKGFLIAEDQVRIFCVHGVPHWAFPVYVDGQIRGCHYRPVTVSKGEKVDWGFEPSKKNGGPGAHPFVLGDLASARECHVFESTWDMLAACDKLLIHVTDGIAAFCTRAAGNGGLVRQIPQNITKVYLWAQNDKPNDKGVIPSENWVTKIRYTMDCPFYRVVVPSDREDLNDWIRAGASVENLLTTMKAATVVERLATQQKRGRRIGWSSVCGKTEARFPH
jgi:hypothetical protein